jgi:alpha-tubulin suppressor-like RCC1 family protein
MFKYTSYINNYPFFSLQVRLNKSLRSNLVVQISCGAEHTLCRNAGGKVYAWGENSDGQLGVGDYEDRLIPTRVNTNIIMSNAYICDIAAGSGHSIAVDDGGALFTWGRGTSGQLGYGKFKIEIDASDIGSSGNGGEENEEKGNDEQNQNNNTDLQRGYINKNKLQIVDTGNENIKPTKLSLKGGVQPVAIACGDEHSMFITNSGKLYSFGSNRDGQLGVGRPTSNQGSYIVILPKEVIGPITKSRVANVSLGHTHSAAITENGELYSWGETFNGRCGYSMAGANVFIPTVVPDFSYIECAKVSCGGYHTCVLTVDQRVYVFGQADARLGIGDRIRDGTNETPTLVAQLTDCVDVCAGSHHNIALKSSGEVVVWGHSGKYGRLGIAKETTSDGRYMASTDASTPISLYFASPSINSGTPQQMTLPAPDSSSSGGDGGDGKGSKRDYRGISCMSNHSCVLMADGKVYSWGCNGSGRLGHGDLIKRNNPERISYFQTIIEGISGVHSNREDQSTRTYDLHKSVEDEPSTIGSTASAVMNFEGTPHLADLEHIIMLARIGYRPVKLREVVLLLREEPSKWLGKQQLSRTAQILETQATMSLQCRKW